MVNTNQTIPGNLIIKNTFVNNLRSKTINNTPFNEYISIDKECNFKNLHVKGNLKLNFEKEHSPNWVDLSENIVRNGGGYKLRGQKSFNGTITVMNANIDYLNNVKVDDVPTIHNNDFDDYTFDTIIANQLFFKKTTVEKLNNKSINEITNNIQFNDQKLNFKKLSLGNVLIHDLKIDENLNDHNFSKYLDDINSIYKIKEINNVEATKNINAKFAKITKSINGVNVELIEEAVRKGAIMSGNITFKNQVFIKNLFIENLNEINLPETLNKLLKKNQNQIISGKYSFNIIRANDLTSNLINNYNLENLIDTNKKTQQVLKGNFKFKSINVKSLKGELICNLKDVINFFKTPPMKIWNSVTIKGNITGINNVFQHIIDNVVRLDQNNIITKPVKFVSNVHTNNIKSKRGLNGIYLDEIHKDALLKKGDDQLINGFKTFKILTCSSAEIDGNADIPIVNAIIIKNINDSLITKDIVNKIKIKGHKVFNSGLNVKKLNTTNISGLNTSHLVNLDDLKSIPKAKFATSDIVGNLSLFHVNNTVDFNKFLLNRFKKDGVNQELSGVYYFDAIETKKSINLVKLNNVEVNDVVEIDKDINLTSKNFEGNLTIQGNVTLNFINDADVLKKYNLSVFYGKPAKFLNDLVLGNVTELNGNVKTNKINGVDIKNVNQFLNSNEIYLKTKQNEEIVKEIQNVVQNHKINIKNMPQDYMYLEKVDELQINIPNTISAEIIDKPDGVLINMIDDSPGNNCGLPKEGCNCQSQHVLKITNNYSLQTISHESSDRIFSYQTDSISAHLITNTISYSRLCTKNLNRNNSESTILTWTDLKGLKTYTKFNLTEGFITGAKYFEYMGEVYVVLTRFYEQSATTHNLDCVIYKFGHSNGLVELVQKIPTKGAWTLYLFNSPQGLILIIGNIFDSTSIFSGTSTDIFIFNEHVKQFELLRNFVGSGAISVTDIVLNGETQIILAQRDSPLVILKYNVDYNNFYIYQNIHQESEIISVSRFYLGGERTKDAYLNVVTETNQFFVYVYKHVEGWIIESQGEIDGLRSLVPFNLNGNIYLLAPSTKLSSLLTVKKYG
nr:uncharacterized protein LOC111425548 [Onthophagus taurus]